METLVKTKSSDVIMIELFAE